jgi:sulfur carrier protein ThiS
LTGRLEYRTVELANTVELVLVGLLRNYGPAQASLPVEQGETVLDLIRELGLDPDLVAIVMVNGRQQFKSHRLQPGDRVKLLPMVGGG